jgi:Tol biopolymer transport system component
VSITAEGNAAGNNTSDSYSVGADGRSIAFRSSATNLLSGTSTFGSEVFVRNISAGITTPVSARANGIDVQDLTSSDSPSISADGRYIAFRSTASNLVTNVTTNGAEIFVRDRMSAPPRWSAGVSTGAMAATAPRIRSSAPTATSSPSAAPPAAWWPR